MQHMLTPRHSTAQHSTAQHSTAQHSTAQHSTAQHSTAQHSTAQHSTAQHRADNVAAQPSPAQLAKNLPCATEPSPGADEAGSGFVTCALSWSTGISAASIRPASSSSRCSMSRSPGSSLAGGSQNKPGQLSLESVSSASSAAGCSTTSACAEQPRVQVNCQLVALGLE